ncbi:MAG: GAF domain-containing protein, partial [Planctomycetota bacterium]
MVAKDQEASPERVRDLVDRRLVWCTIATVAVYGLFHVFLEKLGREGTIGDVLEDQLKLGVTLAAAIPAWITTRRAFRLRGLRLAVYASIFGIVGFCVLDVLDELPTFTAYAAFQPNHPLHQFLTDFLSTGVACALFITSYLIMLAFDGVHRAMRRESEERAAAVEQRDQAHRVMRTVSEGTSRVVGEEFLLRLAEELGQSLEAEYVFIGVPIDDENFETVANYAAGSRQENFTCNTVGGPCGDTSRGIKNFVPRNVRTRYPGVAALEAMSAESYLGIPLFDHRSGQYLGHLCMIDTKEMPEELESLPALGLFADRAAAELYRLRTEGKLQQS